MELKHINAFVFQVNLVDGYNFLDNKGKIFRDVFKKAHNKGFMKIDEIFANYDKVQYVLSTNSFSMKLIGGTIDDITNDNKSISSFILQEKENYIEKTKTICNILNIEKINRFACRFISQFSEPKNHEEMKKLFKLDTNQALIKFEKNISYKGVNFKSSWNGHNITLDIDRYINSQEFDIKEIDKKYDIILSSIQGNMTDIKTLVEEAI